MVDIANVFKSKYLSAHDIGDEPVLATIESWGYAAMQDGEQKLSINLSEFDRPLVLNKTNARNIAGFLGSETDNWIGKKIVLVTALVDYQGQSVEAIRVRAPKNKPTAAQGITAQAPAKPSGPPPGHPAALDDDIGF